MLAPNLIGKSVGLHPVWLILALAVFGALFGFAGPPDRGAGHRGAGRARAVRGRAVPGEPALHRPAAAAGRRLSRGRGPPARARPAGAAGARAGGFLRRAGEPAGARPRRRWPAWPEGRLAVAGPEGSGKTHLAHVWAARSGARLLPGRGLPGLDPAALPADAALAVEDADRLAELPPRRGRRRRGGALSSLQPAGARRRQPDGQRPRAAGALAARPARPRQPAAAAPVARLEPPDDALLAAVLVKLFADRQIAVAPELIGYLVGRIDRAFAAAEATGGAARRAPAWRATGRSPRASPRRCCATARTRADAGNDRESRMGRCSGRPLAIELSSNAPNMEPPRPGAAPCSRSPKPPPSTPTS